MNNFFRNDSKTTSISQDKVRPLKDKKSIDNKQSINKNYKEIHKPEHRKIKT